MSIGFDQHGELIYTPKAMQAQRLGQASSPTPTSANPGRTTWWEPHCCSTKRWSSTRGLRRTLTVVRRGDVDPSATGAEKDLVVGATLDTGVDAAGE